MVICSVQRNKWQTSASHAEWSLILRCWFEADGEPRRHEHFSKTLEIGHSRDLSLVRSLQVTEESGRDINGTKPVDQMAFQGFYLF